MGEYPGMRRLGIIGGASWSATALYYEQLNRAVVARIGGVCNAPVVIESLDAAQVAAWQQAGAWDAAAASACAAGNRLRAAGCDGLLIASGTLHRVAAEVGACAGLPVIHLGEAIAGALAADGRRRVALIGCQSAMIEDFLKGPIIRRGITLAEMSGSAVAIVDRILNEELIAGRVVRDSQRQLKTLICELDRSRVEALVLGCPELALAVDVRANVMPVYDATAVHARAAAEWMLDRDTSAALAAA
jgi:aspartate racemase